MKMCLVTKKLIASGGCFEMLPYDSANHAPRVLGPRSFYKGENGGRRAKFNKYCGPIVEEQLHVCMPSILKTTKLNSQLHWCVQVCGQVRCLPPRFFTTEPVSLKFFTHNRMELRSETDTWEGICNCVRNARWAVTIVIVANERLNSKSSLRIWPLVGTANEVMVGLEWGQNGKKLPPPLRWVPLSPPPWVSPASPSTSTEIGRLFCQTLYNNLFWTGFLTLIKIFHTISLG